MPPFGQSTFAVIEIHHAMAPPANDVAERLIVHGKHHFLRFVSHHFS